MCSARAGASQDKLLERRARQPFPSRNAWLPEQLFAVFCSVFVTKRFGSQSTIAKDRRLWVGYFQRKASSMKYRMLAVRLRCVRFFRIRMFRPGATDNGNGDIRPSSVSGSTPPTDCAPKNRQPVARFAEWAAKNTCRQRMYLLLRALRTE